MFLLSTPNLYLSLWLFVSLFTACNGGKKESNATATVLNENTREKKKNIELVRNDKEKRVDVFINGAFFTSYIYPETLEKPILYPVKTAHGTTVTRGFPLNPRPGEQVDHPHQVGVWFTYGDVNGLDFWNNSYAIPEKRKDHYGSILHKEINDISSGNEKGELEVTMDWVDSEGEALLRENTTFIFRGTDKRRMIDRNTTLTVQKEAVTLKDNKEGMFGIRVARELEHPSDKPVKLTDANGKPTDEPVLNNEGVTGWYRSSKGEEGTDAWGTRAKWMKLSGTIKGESITIAILDHPDNIGYPAYWHARGYGLFAANPFAQKTMGGGKEEFIFRLAAGESMTFKYRIIIYSGNKVSDKQVNKDFAEFIR